jgi:hypothetical protein
MIILLMSWYCHFLLKEVTPLCSRHRCWCRHAEPMVVSCFSIQHPSSYPMGGCVIPPLCGYRSPGTITMAAQFHQSSLAQWWGDASTLYVTTPVHEVLNGNGNAWFWLVVCVRAGVPMCSRVSANKDPTSLMYVEHLGGLHSVQVLRIKKSQWTSYMSKLIRSHLSLLLSPLAVPSLRGTIIAKLNIE